MQTLVKPELNETAAQIARDLSAIRQWLSQSPHIRARDDDLFLLTFLRSCKYSLEKTKKKLESFYTVRSRWYAMTVKEDAIDSTMLAIIDTGVYIPINIENPATDVPIILLNTFQRWKNYPIETYTKYIVKQMEIMVSNGKCAVSKVVCITDYTNFPVEFFDPSLVQEHVLLFHQTMPALVASIHLINVAPAVEILINLVMPFLNKKLKERLIIHKSLADLHQHVKPEDLPHEYGGTSGSLNESISRWKKVVCDNSAILENLSSYRIDDSKRSSSEPQMKNGSFRSLTID